MINISQIKYFKAQLSYKGERLYIDTPTVICKTGVEKYFNKYELTLEITDNEFIDFIKKLDENNRKHCSEESIYRSNLTYFNNKYYLKLKVPYRYNKFEVDIDSERIYLPTMSEIKPGIEVKCKIHVRNMWHYHSNDKRYLSGCIMEVKNINIL